MAPSGGLTIYKKFFAEEWRILNVSSLITSKIENEYQFVIKEIFGAHPLLCQIDLQFDNFDDEDEKKKAKGQKKHLQARYARLKKQIYANVHNGRDHESGFEIDDAFFNTSDYDLLFRRPKMLQFPW